MVRHETIGLIHRNEKDGDWYIYPQFVAHKTLITLIRTQRKVPETSNLAYTMSVAQRKIYSKKGLFICL